MKNHVTPGRAKDGSMKPIDEIDNPSGDHLPWAFLEVHAGRV